MTSLTSATKANFWVNPNFARLWLGQSVSIFGDFIFNATVILWIGSSIAYKQSWAPLAVSGVLVATAIPTLLIGPLAGVFVDRWNKRRTMLAMDLCRAILNMLLVLLTLSSVYSPFFASMQVPAVLLAEIYGIILLMTTCTQFFNPASVAMLGNIVEKNDLARASGRQQATSGLANILGLALSAPLFFGLGAQWALFINACSFLVSFVTILAIHPPKAEASAQEQARPENNFMQEFREGLHFYAHNPALMTILIASSLFIAGVAVVNALNFFFITINLHLSAALFSYINAIYGAGAIIGAIFAAQGAKRLGVRNMFGISLLLTGVLLIFYARSVSLVPALLIFFLLGMPSAITNAMFSPLILDATPDRFVGRVIAVLSPMLTLVRIVSAAFVGYLDSNVLGNFQADLLGIHFSAIDTLFIAAGLLAIGAGLYAQVNLKRQMKAQES